MDESQFKALRELASNGEVSQRELSKKMGLSLGRVNYIINSLIKSGYIKARRFKNSRNKIGYMYILTPRGIKKKLSLAKRFLQIKTMEYQDLQEEIEALKSEIEKSAGKGKT